MKKLLLLVFFIPFLVKGQQRHVITDHFSPITLSSADTARIAFDTIKIRIEIDDCNLCLLTVINGYLVRKFISYGMRHPISDKLYTEFKYMDDEYESIDPSRIWSWREKAWKSNQSRSIEFLTPRMIW